MSTPAEDPKMRAAEQRAKVVELRRRRLTFADIGQELGFSAQRAHQIYTQALREVPVQAVEQHRAEELTLIDDAISDLWPIAHDHTQARTAVEAWEAIETWAERKAKLLGLDSPVRVSVDAEQLGREIEQLLAAGLDDGDDPDDGDA